PTGGPPELGLVARLRRDRAAEAGRVPIWAGPDRATRPSPLPAQAIVEIPRRKYSLGVQRQRQQLGDMVHEMHLKLLPHLFRHFAPVGSILIRQEHLFNPEAGRREDLFLNPT